VVTLKDAGEKEATINSLRNIAVDMREQCVDLINSSTIGTKILPLLPSNDKTDVNIEVAEEILNLLIAFEENLFNSSSNEKEILQFQS
jgi:hypothetical protein